VADPKKRIVVDGVDLGRMFQFPRVLGAVTASLQPPRLVVALLMVVALISFGRGWDAFTEPRVSSEGLLSPDPSPEVLRLAQESMWTAIDRYDVDAPWPRESRLEVRDVLPLIERGYRLVRGRSDEGRDPVGKVGAGPGLLATADAEYLATRELLLGVAPMGAFEATVATVVSGLNRAVQGIVYLRPQSTFEAGADVFMRLPISLWQRERAFMIVFGLVFLLVMSIGGGALSRMAACEFAGQERLRVRDAFDFALGNWFKLTIAPVLPLLIAGGLALVMVVLGLFLAPWLDVVGGLLYGIAMLCGFLLAFLLLGYAVGFPLLLPAVACENCDAADAQQRAYAYVLSRPLHLLGYATVGLVGLGFGYVVVALVASVTLNTSASLAGVLTDNSALTGAGGFGVFDLAPTAVGDIHADWHNTWAAGMISFWQRVVVDLVAAYVIAYFFTASTMVYLLMRRTCDGQDIEEIWRPGLTPGTLVPLPRPRIDYTEAAHEPKDVAGRMITSALRTATTVRYGHDTTTKESAEAKDEPTKDEPVSATKTESS